MLKPFFNTSFFWFMSFLMLGSTTLSSAQTSSFPRSSSLRFRPDGTFKILGFGDVHWNKMNEKDQKTLQAMETIVASEIPDFVIYTGDNCLSSTYPDVRLGYQQLTQPVVKRNIPWAATLGNHDAEYGGLTRKKVYECQLGLPGSLSKMGPSSIYGYGNFILPVMSHDGKKIAALLYVLDSNSYVTTNGKQIYNWIHHDQVEWYRQASAYYKKYNHGKDLPSYMFFHIPLPEYNFYWQNCKPVGERYEDPCVSPVNSGLYAALLENRNIKGVFVGHDHINDYIAQNEGIWMGYVRGISYNTYGKEGFLHGSRLIQLSEGTPSFDTWLRLEDNTVINKIHCE